MWLPQRTEMGVKEHTALLIKTILGKNRVDLRFGVGNTHSACHAVLDLRRGFSGVTE